MSTHTLQYQSPEKLFILTGNCPPHSAQIDQWQISETFTPNTHPDLGAGTYHIVIEAKVASSDEQMAACSKSIAIAQELDIAWCYLFGKPFKAVRLQLLLTDGPEDWSGNFNEVRVAIQRATQRYYCAAMQIGNREWYEVSHLPLERLLNIRAAYLATSPILRELIGLHVSAHKAPLGGLLMLAKALEVAGRHYGAERAVRNAGLQQTMDRLGVTPHLKQNVEWLFNLANERFDIRHAVDKDAPGVSLHPKLTPVERREFEEDSTLVVRAFICDQLGVDFYIVPRK
jgi:hypothetical protein